MKIHPSISPPLFPLSLVLEISTTFDAGEKKVEGKLRKGRFLKVKLGVTCNYFEPVVNVIVNDIKMWSAI